MESNVIKKKPTLFKDAIALFIITVVAGLTLSVVYEITKGPIKQKENEKNVEAYSAVFPEADDIPNADELMKNTEDTELSSLDPSYKNISVNTIKQAVNANDEIIGYIIHLTTKDSYGSEMQLVIGYSINHVIKGLDAPKFEETMEVGKLLNQYIPSFVGKEAIKFSHTDEADTTKIDAISGATVSSKAILNAVNAGMDLLNEYLEDLGGEVK